MDKTALLGLRDDRNPITENYSSGYQITPAANLYPSETTKTIIVVENDKAVVGWIEGQLAHLGYKVIGLADPEKLAELLLTECPTAILVGSCGAIPQLTDDGSISVFRDKTATYCPIIQISGQDDFQSRLASVRSGYDGFLVKPIDSGDLFKMLNVLTDPILDAPVKVMLVDDDPIVSEMYSAILKADGMNTRCENNPESVVDRLPEFQPDVILMDVNMPECSGFELASIIRQNQKFAYIPIIFLTAVSNTKRRYAAIASGGDDFLDKSTAPEIISATVQNRATRSREIKRIMSQLIESETRFRTFAHSAKDAIISMDAAKRIVLYNPAANRLLGICGSEILGSPASRYVAEHDLEKFHGAFEQITFETESQESTNFVEIELLQRHGTPVPVELALTKWYVGEKIYYSAIIRDITLRKRGQEELLRHRNRLQEMVADATSKLRKKSMQLEAVLETEREVNQQQRQFISMASHEFRTPMAIIDGSAQRILRTNPDGTSELVKDRAQKIRNAVKRMNGLIESTLMAAVIDAGKQELNPEPYDMAGMIRAICEQHQEMSNTHSVRIDLEGFPKTVYADPIKMEQVFTNLISNAIKYSPNADLIEIEGSMERGKIILTVRDFGVGIPEADMPCMFQRFFRASTSSGIPGTGIGLHLVKNLIEMHDGTISICSEEDKGTEISVAMPVNGRVEMPLPKSKCSGNAMTLGKTGLSILADPIKPHSAEISGLK
ncbi:MAG: response regulator [Rhodospirillales bacterium]|nr:response regulator [Rhodospirillales bacterium]